MVEKLKNYYRNSPKRIGWSWVGIHVFFLLIVVVRFVIDAIVGNYGMGEVFPIIGIAVIAFPALFLSPSNYITWISIGILFIAYYGLFAFIVVSAKNTASRRFVVYSWIFTGFFIFNLIVGLISVFAPGLLY